MRFPCQTVPVGGKVAEVQILPHPSSMGTSSTCASQVGSGNLNSRSALAEGQPLDKQVQLSAARTESAPEAWKGICRDERRGPQAWPPPSLLEEQRALSRTVLGYSAAFCFERLLEANPFLSSILVSELACSQTISIKYYRVTSSNTVELDFGMSTHPYFVLREKPYYHSRYIQSTLHIGEKDDWVLHCVVGQSPLWDLNYGTQESKAI